jgi:poly(3-hydroxybutyrate) depolymerase
VGVSCVAVGVAGSFFGWAREDTRPAGVVREAIGARPVDVVEDSLRTVAIADAGGRTCRLSVPRDYRRVGGDRWPIAVILHTNADLRGSGASTRLPAILDRDWFVLFGEGEEVGGAPPVRTWNAAHAPADADYVRASVAQMTREYRLDPSRVAVVGEDESAGVAFALACSGPDDPLRLPEGWAVVAIRGGRPPCGEVGVDAPVWVGSGGTWQPIYPPDPDLWLPGWLAARLAK